MTDNGRPLVCRGIRGATTAETNTAEDILEATHEMVTALVGLNDLQPEDVVSAFFTTTTDLTAIFPALAARQLGWSEVPLMCAHEMAVPGALDHVVRVLLHVNTARGPADIRHVYLKRARQLRPEWGVDDDQLANLLGRAANAEPATVAAGTIASTGEEGGSA
jgi:chorismate mutase